MDQATLDALVGRRELESILSLRPTRLNEIMRTPEQHFPAPVKVLEDGTRLWNAEEIRAWGEARAA